MTPLTELLEYSDTVASRAAQTVFSASGAAPPTRADDYPLRIVASCLEEEVYANACGYIFGESSWRSAGVIFHMLYTQQHTELERATSPTVYYRGDMNPSTVQCVDMMKNVVTPSREHPETTAVFDNARRVFGVILLWIARFGRLADYVYAIAATHNRIPYVAFHTAQRTLHLYTVQLFHDTLHSAHQDTPWAWQEPLLVEQLIQSMNSDDMHTIQQAVQRYGV